MKKVSLEELEIQDYEYLMKAINFYIEKSNCTEIKEIYYLDLRSKLERNEATTLYNLGLL